VTSSVSCPGVVNGGGGNGSGRTIGISGVIVVAAVAQYTLPESGRKERYAEYLERLTPASRRGRNIQARRREQVWETLIAGALKR